MSGTDTAAMVPSRFDVVIDGHGYVFWNGLMQSLPFRNQRAAYSYTPTFVQRSNTSGNYGDNQQDFFLTASQNDWSGGQGERYFHLGDKATTNKAWTIVGGDPVAIPGQVNVGAAIQTIAAPGSSGSIDVHAACFYYLGQPNDLFTIATANGHLYGMKADGTLTDRGAHAAGTVPRGGVCSDGQVVYIAGASKIRKYIFGSGFSDFAASPPSSFLSLCYLNNALYGCDGQTLYVFSTAGASTALFTWKDATGASYQLGDGYAKVVAYGGDLLILFTGLGNQPSQLWLYDGTNTYMVAMLPQSSAAWDVQVLNGVVFISGAVYDTPAGVSLGGIPVVWAYLNGNLDELWRATPGTAATSQVLAPPALGTYAGKLVFTDSANSNALMAYDFVTGAIYNLGVPASGILNLSFIASAPNAFLYGNPNGASSNLYLYPQAGTFASSATVTSALIDFDNSLTKTFRSVKIDWEGGGTADIKYQADSLTGAFTTLRTGAVSGTEYLFPANTQGHTVSVQIVLNNSGGNIPTLKRVYVRASPVQQNYRRCQYVLDLTGAASSQGGIPNPVPLRDGTFHTLTGSQLAANLIAAITSATPVPITDRFGIYTGVFEQGEGITELDEVRPGEFLAQVTTREV